MEKDKILSLYENAYYKELDDSNSVVSRFPILITGAALIINIYVLLFRSLSINNSIWLVLVLGVVSLTPFIWMMRNFYKVFLAKKYMFMPTLDQLEIDRKSFSSYEEELLDYNKKVQDPKKVTILEPNDLFLELMLEHYAECSKHNREVNSYRKDWFFKALKWVWINMAVCTTIAVLIIAINTTQESDYVRKEATASASQANNSIQTINNKSY